MLLPEKHSMSSISAAAGVRVCVCTPPDLAAVHLYPGHAVRARLREELLGRGV